MADLTKMILPVCYLPPIDYYCHIIRNSNILFEKFETYPKQTFRNRTIILSANGPLRLTIPVIKPYGNKTKTSDVLIDNNSSWNKIHIRAINSAYNKSPFYLYYKDEIEELILKSGETLIDFNISLFCLINKFLRFQPNFEFTKEYIKDIKVNYDYRQYGKDHTVSDFTFKDYTQVFNDRIGFTPNLSIIDLIFNKGPEAMEYLKNSVLKDEET